MTSSLWNHIDTFLAKIAAQLNYQREDVRLFRDKHLVTPNHADEYLKPDVGFGCKLNKYSVRYQGDDLITSWGLYEFPSCCAFCVSTQAYVAPKFRGNGINTLASSLRQSIAANAGYSAIICTDVESNQAERHTLKTAGFSDIYTIDNKRTGNTVIISVKKL